MDLRHYIIKSIRSYYKRKLAAPIIFLAALVLLSFIFPIRSILAPKNITDSDSIETLYSKRVRYVSGTFTNAYFTGYRKRFMNRTNGYYYYVMHGDECIILLLKPDTCQSGEPKLDQVTINAKIIRNSHSEKELLKNLAKDLSWNTRGLTNSVSMCMLSEPDGDGTSARLLRFIYLFFIIYSFVSLFLSLLLIAFPKLSPPVLRLSSCGNPVKMLDEAEEELETLPQLATEDMFITQHYFIETSKYGIAIVPISEIIWIYKYSTLHKILWHHFAISYTLYITAKKKIYIKCPKNTKTNIDGIMDYLAEANHDILVGFSEENRRKVEKVQNDFGWIEKLKNILSKKV